MKMSLYVIYDSKAQIYNKPFCMQNDQVATRACIDLVNDPTTDCAKHPTDYALYWIGSYDDENAFIEYNPPEHMLSFHEIQHAMDFSKDSFKPEPINNETIYAPEQLQEG